MRRMTIPLLLLACTVFLSVSCTSLIGNLIGDAFGSGSSGNGEEEGVTLFKTVGAVKKSFEDITPEQEYYIGRAVSAVILDQYDPYTDAEATAYLNKLGQLLAMGSDRPMTFGGYHFLILDSDEINAFAAPSGHIFVSRGMLRLASNESMLAAVLAHEIGHVQERHGLEAIKKSRVTSALTMIGATAAKTFGPSELAKITGLFEDSILDITTTMVNNGYSRSFEKEADRAAVTILSRFGYDPNALVRLLERMDEELDPEGKDFAKTHPDPQDRIEFVLELIDEMGTGAASSGAAQSRFQDALGGI